MNSKKLAFQLDAYKKVLLRLLAKTEMFSNHVSVRLMLKKQVAIDESDKKELSEKRKDCSAEVS